MNYTEFYNKLENLNQNIKKLDIEIKNLHSEQINLLDTKSYIEQQRENLEYLKHNRAIINLMLFVLSLCIISLSSLSGVWPLLFLEIPIVPFSIFSTIVLKKKQKDLETLDFDSQLKELDKKMEQILNEKSLSLDSFVKLQIERSYIEDQIKRGLKDLKNDKITKENTNIIDDNSFNQINNEKICTPKIKRKTKNRDLN